MIDILGFKDKNHKMSRLKFSDNILNRATLVPVIKAEDVEFIIVRTTTGDKPTFEINNSTNISN
ncbi:MAG: hypothetical protein Q8905_13330 [Bacteroidota bacterium]|nr:hypothetical protein [Bacteroidota bacterium]